MALVIKRNDGQHVLLTVTLETMKKLVAENVEPVIDITLYGVEKRPGVKGRGNLVFDDANHYFEVERPERSKQVPQVSHE